MTELLSGMAILGGALLILGFIIGNLAANPPLAVIGVWTAGLGLLILVISGVAAGAWALLP